MSEDDLNGPFRCETCAAELEHCQRRYILNMTISDYSGQTWITAFNDEAEKMLNGKTADELNLIMQSDHNKFTEVLNSLTLRPMRFTLRVKVETVNDEPRVKASVARVAPIDFAKESKTLLGEIQALLM